MIETVNYTAFHFTTKKSPEQLRGILFACFSGGDEWGRHAVSRDAEPDVPELRVCGEGPDGE